MSSLLLIAGNPCRASAMDAPVALNIASQNLGDALRKLAKRGNLQILFDPDLVAGRVSPTVADLLTPREALNRLLRGMPLEAVEQAADVVVIRARQMATAPPVVVRSPAVAVPAYTDVTGALEEIVVTSQRRLERLQDVPISVRAFSRAVMEIQGTRSIDDIARLTPGVTFGRGRNNNSESSEISIRGIGSSAGAATTGVYIDDTPIQSRHLSFGTFNTYPVLFDIDRVEVLRGPQGTLFGSGSEGGTVRFITPEPDLHAVSSYVRSELSSTHDGDPSAELGAAVGGPLIEDRLGFRASVSLRREGGFVDRIDWHRRTVVDADANTATTQTARLALKWMPSNAVTVSPSIFYQRRRLQDTSAYWAQVPGMSDPTQGQFTQTLRNGNAIANPSTDSFMLAALKVNWELRGAMLTSNTSYFKRDESAITDYAEYNLAVFLDDPYPPPRIVAPTNWSDVQRNWTEELRLESTAADARVNWTAGVFYQRAAENTVENVFDPALVAQLGLPVYRGGYVYYQEPFKSLDTQLAVFGQADLKIGERLKVTLGLRYTRARFDGEAYFAGPAVGSPVSSAGRLREHPLTPKIGAAYQINAENLVYATLAKGYRIGGANPAVGQFCYGDADSALGSIGLSQVPPKYDADSVWSYEIGSKNAFADHRGLLNASLYFVQWDNIQQQVPLTACGFQFISNLGRARSQGMDLQAQFKLSDAWAVGGNLAVTDARYTQTVRLAPSALSLVQDGDHLAGSPWSLTLFAEGRHPMAAGESYGRVDFQYSARQSDTVPTMNALNGGNPDWFDGVPAQSLTSLRFGIKRGGLDVSLFVQNLFDTRPRLTVNQDVGLGQSGTPLLYVITWRPRTFGVTATYHR